MKEKKWTFILEMRVFSVIIKWINAGPGPNKTRSFTQETLVCDVVTCSWELPLLHQVKCSGSVTAATIQGPSTQSPGIDVRTQSLAGGSEGSSNRSSVHLHGGDHECVSGRMMSFPLSLWPMKKNISTVTSISLSLRQQDVNDSFCAGWRNPEGKNSCRSSPERKRWESLQLADFPPFPPPR